MNENADDLYDTILIYKINKRLEMEEMKKIANNLTWFRPIVEKSRINFKNAHKELTDFD